MYIPASEQSFCYLPILSSACSGEGLYDVSFAAIRLTTVKFVLTVERANGEQGSNFRDKADDSTNFPRNQYRRVF